MTYCVALRLNSGLVCLSDTRTNAGVDNISRYRKSFTWEVQGERAICMMTAGSLSITQGILTQISADIRRANAGENVLSILNANSMFAVAQIVGDYMRQMQDRYRVTLLNQGVGADATVMVAGQRAGGSPRVFMVYTAGNFIEATPDTPFFQIGEHKYGKPILDRMISMDTPIEQALKAVYVSMESTIKSNLSVGMPLDLTVIRSGELRIGLHRRIEQDDADWQLISRSWAEALAEGFHALPEIKTQ